MLNLKNPTESDKHILNFLNTKYNSKMSITDIANKTWTSTSTISRLVRKLGFLNYSELKLYLNSKLQTKKQNIFHSDKLGDTFHKISIKMEKYDKNVIKAAQLIKKNKKVYVFAANKTISLAHEFVWNLKSAGIDAEFIDFYDKNFVLFKKQSIFIIFSKTGNSSSAYKLANLVHQNNFELISFAPNINGKNWKKLSKVYFDVRNTLSHEKIDKFMLVGTTFEMWYIQLKIIKHLFNNEN